MKAPPAWNQLGEQLHPDFFRIGGDHALENLIPHFDQGTRRDLIAYLTFLTSGSLTMRQQFDAWIASGALVDPNLEHIDPFLRHLLNLLSGGQDD